MSRETYVPTYVPVFEDSNGKLNTDGRGKKTCWVYEKETGYVLQDNEAHDHVCVSGLYHKSKLIDGTLIASD